MAKLKLTLCADHHILEKVWASKFCQMAIIFALLERYTMSMDIQTIRRINFAPLRRERSISELSEKTGIDCTYLSRIQKGYRSFSETKARQVEAGLSLPHLWLDGPHSSSNPILIQAVRELERVPDNLLPALLAARRALRKTP
ncbi:MAG: transcriptional regulator with XRE-family HTH domain [Cellvibrionaceae bacterium]|jgi:transcriptional regulator with XRE-family HTH domain